MNEAKDAKPNVKGWYSVKFKSSLTPSEREENKLAKYFIDWAYFDGNCWDIPATRESFYVLNVIKPKKDQE
ncbi:MAG TPA: hypothetical protein EYN54_01365 [Methylococcaceae bacterium]|nr:hypothetical protein [Methylococcaceae bacterium]